jgi:hypothetical protein
MIDITFSSTAELRFQAELLTGTWVDTLLGADDAGGHFHANSFTTTTIDLASATGPRTIRAQEDAGDPFLVIRVTNHSGDLEVRVPGQSFPTIPANTTVVITYPRVTPLVEKD